MKTKTYAAKVHEGRGTPQPSAEVFGTASPESRLQIRQILRDSALQPKLVVGAPDDLYEQEADRVAEQVMRMPEPAVQRQEQPQEDEEDELLQAKAADGVFEVFPPLNEDLTRLRGGGQPLDPQTRAYFEPRFGVDFGDVRIHSDSRAAAAAQAVRAQAFTLGRHIVFGEGRYAPDSDPGKRLLAHELTHVLQQSQSAEQTIRRDQVPPAPGSTLETAIPSPWQGILRGGLAGVLSSEILLMELYGDAAATELANAIRRDQVALKFVRDYSGFNAAIPVVALADTRNRDGSFDVDVARRRAAHLALPVLDARARREQSERARRTDAQSLVGLQTWAEEQRRQQGVVDTAAVVGLDAAQMRSLADLRRRLPAMGAVGPQAAAILNEVAQGIHGVAEGTQRGGLRYALPRLQGEDEVRQMEGLVSVYESQTALLTQLRRMPEVLALVDAEDLSFALHDELRRLRGAVVERTVDLGAVEQVRDNLRDLRRRIRERAAALGQMQDSPVRLDFVLRCLLWINGEPGATAPTDDEATRLAGLLRTTVESDLLRLIPGLTRDQIQLLRQFGETILPRQLEARHLMETAGQVPAGAVPTLAEAQGYFASLRGQSNADVIHAYESFSRAWFYHRIVANMDDLSEPTIESLFGRAASITGTRPLVCSGYALMGATLLRAAGARLRHYTMAVRATDQQIRSNTIDTGHAIAVLRRNGATLIVSNDSIVDNDEDAIGPDAVAWAHSQATLHQANGASLAAAKRALEQALSLIANR